MKRQNSLIYNKGFTLSETLIINNPFDEVSVTISSSNML
jgi:hypothetical protein